MRLRYLLANCIKLQETQSHRRPLGTSTTGAPGELRFDGQTAIVTGAGRGLGQQHALLLATRGANLIINDQDEAADKLADEINTRVAPGRAVACRQSVASPEGAAQLVNLALDRFGSIDILINNAGILRDKSFAKMTLDDWDQVMGIHLRGSFLVSHACWPHMRRQHYGRILMTGSTSGLYGNFGQANYAAAKMGLVGLSNTLAIEGAKDGIQCNVLVPMASSRMTAGILPEPLAERLSPAFVSPLAAWLCHRDCPATGGVFEGAGRWFGRHSLVRGQGAYLASAGATGDSIEQVRDSWAQIADTSSGRQMDSFGEHLAELMQKLDEPEVA